MKVYLAGKITGDPNYREKFAAAAKKLEERAGVTVISPAVTPEGLKKADYMRICFAMLESADTAVFLPDWEDSPGHDRVPVSYTHLTLPTKRRV